MVSGINHPGRAVFHLYKELTITVEENGKRVKKKATVREILINARRNLLPLKACAALAEINRLTLENWLRQGEREVQKFENGEEENYDELGKFYLEFEKASASQVLDIKSRMIRKVKGMETAPVDWIGSQTVLERFDPLSEGQRQMIHSEGHQKITVVHEGLTAERWSRGRSLMANADEEEPIETAYRADPPQLVGER